MFLNWLDTISEEKIKEYSISPMGSKSDFFTNLSILNEKKIALISTNNEFSNQIRSKLYNLGDFEKMEEFVDLGNFKKNHVDFITPILQELINSDIIPIILGLDFNEYVNFLNIAEISNNQIITNNIASFLGQVNGNLSQFNFMAYQRHLSEHNILNHKAVSTKDSCNLGSLKTNIHHSEILLRNAESVLLDLAVLKKSESPNNPRNKPNGLFTEEACVLAKNAGSSNMLDCFNLSGFSKNNCDIEAHICAELIWYFIEGFKQRTLEVPRPGTNNGMKEIIVDSEVTEEHFKFYKSRKTGRYWFQSSNSKKIIPCSEKEYLEMTSQNIPDRILQHLGVD